jgi:hypothetical protein
MRSQLVSLALVVGSGLAPACGDPPPSGDTEASSGTTQSDPSSSTTPGVVTDPDSSTGEATSTGEASETGSTGDPDSSDGSSSSGSSSDSGSTSPATETTDGTTGEVDEDRDGHPTSTDCDDTDPEIHPGADERCNGLDDDCDPATLEDGVASVDGQGSHASLFAAVTAAIPGSEIRVCAGVWQENVGIPHALTLVSQEGAAVTIIDGGGVGPALAVSAGEVTITGFTLTNGQSFGFGGGLSVTGTELVTVEDCLITGNVSTDGAGIYAYAGAQLVVTGTEISGNTGGIGGGLAVQSNGSGSLSLFDCTIADNVSDEFGAGMVLVGVPMVEIDSTAIIDNDSLDAGGIGIVDSMVTILDSTVLRNTATSVGGGLLLYAGSGAVTVVDSDWGTGADDNGPQDVAIPGVGSWAAYGAGASFECDAAGCS